ncbi:hypothetical protein O181_007474 [Austropuccinia psidii MF-1]|uniref:Uncharacterized protein n=1 Tax=Austropuccinia psidii MF-1 TaxID=1389203 RepID=A0A9Q3BKY7_9BASI|nr:hypothetical protein [Austropuccinia psidii MF-1]
MPVQHIYPAKNTRSQRNQSVITPTERASLDWTASAHQLSASLDRGPPIEGEASPKRGGINSIISRSFSVLLGGYTEISQGTRSRLQDVEYEAREGSVE